MVPSPPPDHPPFLVSKSVSSVIGTGTVLSTHLPKQGEWGGGWSQILESQEHGFLYLPLFHTFKYSASMSVLQIRIEMAREDPNQGGQNGVKSEKNSKISSR